VIGRYRTHPEAKSLGPDRMPCGRRTIGVLRRRRVVLGGLVHIGKEMNRIEDVEQGLVHDWAEVQLMFRESRGHHHASTALGEMETRVQRKCDSCGAAIDSFYCSPACRQRAYRQRRRDAMF
jgi:hypothetical protein